MYVLGAAAEVAAALFPPLEASSASAKVATPVVSLDASSRGAVASSQRVSDDIVDLIIIGGGKRVVVVVVVSVVVVVGLFVVVGSGGALPCGCGGMRRRL